MSIYGKLQNIQSELVTPKDKKNEFGGYSYRSAEDILAVAKPLCRGEGCTLTMTEHLEECAGRAHIVSVATLTDNETGESITSTGIAAEAIEKKGMDVAQISGAAMSYARKYALGGLFAIDNERDPDNPSFKKLLTGYMKQHGMDVSEMAAWESLVPKIEFTKDTPERVYQFIYETLIAEGEAS